MININISVPVHESIAEKAQTILSTPPIIHDFQGKTIVVFGDYTYNFEVADFLANSTIEEREQLIIQAKIKRLTTELRELEQKLK